MKIIWSPQAGDLQGETQISLDQGVPNNQMFEVVMVVTPDIDTAAGSFVWTIPASLPAGSNYVIQVGTPQTVETVGYSNPFTINSAPIE